MKKYHSIKSTEELCKLLGLPQVLAPKVKFRTELTMAISEYINKHSLTHLEAAKKADVGRTVITAVVNGNILKISTDRLLDIALRLGIKTQLKIA